MGQLTAHLRVHHAQLSQVPVSSATIINVDSAGGFKPTSIGTRTSTFSETNVTVFEVKVQYHHYQKCYSWQIMRLSSENSMPHFTSHISTYLYIYGSECPLIVTFDPRVSIIYSKHGIDLSPLQWNIKLLIPSKCVSMWISKAAVEWNTDSHQFIKTSSPTRKFRELLWEPSFQSPGHANTYRKLMMRNTSAQEV